MLLKTFDVWPPCTNDKGGPDTHSLFSHCLILHTKLENTCENPIRLLDQYTTFHIPVDQTVERCTNNSKVMGSIPRECVDL